MTRRGAGGERHAPPTPVSLAAGPPVRAHAHPHPHIRAVRRGGDLPRPAGRRPRTGIGARVWRGIGAIPLSGPELSEGPAVSGATTGQVSTAGPRGEGTPEVTAAVAVAGPRPGPPTRHRPTPSRTILCRPPRYGASAALHLRRGWVEGRANAPPGGPRRR